MSRFTEPIFSEMSVVYNARGEIVSPPPGPKRERALALERAWRKYWVNGDESELVELGIFPKKEEGAMVDEEARRRAAAARLSAPMSFLLIRNAAGEITHPPPGPERDHALKVERAWQQFYRGDRSRLIDLGILPAD